MRKFTSDEFQHVLHDHAQWIKSFSKSGKRADLSGADLSGADLSGANLRGADLSETDLRVADLRVADLRGANLRGADLSGADLSGAYLRGASGLFAPMACPSVGAFVAWKKCRHDLIVKLLIPEDARRLSATGRKCWCDKAEVLEIQNLDGTNAGTTAYSMHTGNFAYVVGQTVTPDSFCEDRWQECSNGIHFFITREEAVRY